jgi:putative tricarboxylic transport membrane protein
MEIFSNLSVGLVVALSLTNIVACFTGVLLGTVVGVLPGIGPVTTIAILLPVTYALEPTTALIMLAGIYYGAQYGGSTTAILMRLPGEASSVMTAVDGYEMARQGRAGAALGIAAIGSFIAGTVATVLVFLFAPTLAEVALQFGPAEYFSLMLCGLAMAIALSRASMLKSFGMAIIGLMFGLIGTDINSGVRRFTLDIPSLADGVEFVIISIAVFGIADIMLNLETREAKSEITKRIGSVLPTRKDISFSMPAILRSTGIGSALGLLPGGGALLASFAAYSIEKKLAKSSGKFGEGDIRGVAAPESANNAGAQTSFIPMLTLGVPSNPTMAMMIGAMMVHGISPGPSVMTQAPGLFWGLIASMWVGNIMLVALNMPMIGLWVKLLQVPYRVLFPIIMVMCCIGTYSVNLQSLDLYLLAFFAAAGYLFIKLDCDPAPLILGFVLGPMMEENFRRAMLISRGSPEVFVSEPISLVFIILTILISCAIAFPAIRAKRQAALTE